MARISSQKICRTAGLPYFPCGVIFANSPRIHFTAAFRADSFGCGVFSGGMSPTSILQATFLHSVELVFTLSIELNCAKSMFACLYFGL